MEENILYAENIPTEIWDVPRTHPLRCMEENILYAENIPTEIGMCREHTH
jgi:hypothetical protein